MVTVVSTPPKRRVICENCESELEFTKLEIRHHVSRIPGFADYHFIVCPVCTGTVKTKDNMPPARR